MTTLSLSKGHPHLLPPPSKGEEILLESLKYIWIDFNKRFYVFLDKKE
jgi:hypothetical protein